jgi:hypothetical protein
MYYPLHGCTYSCAEESEHSQYVAVEWMSSTNIMMCSLPRANANNMLVLMTEVMTEVMPEFLIGRTEHLRLCVVTQILQLDSHKDTC